jgi:hypothetical protein
VRQRCLRPPLAILRESRLRLAYLWRTADDEYLHIMKHLRQPAQIPHSPSTGSMHNLCMLDQQVLLVILAPRARKGGRLARFLSGTRFQALRTHELNRNLHSLPSSVLDAPGMMDDFYLNLIDWSSGESSYNIMASTFQQAEHTCLSFHKLRGRRFGRSDIYLECSIRYGQPSGKHA